MFVSNTWKIVSFCVNAERENSLERRNNDSTSNMRAWEDGLRQEWWWRAEGGNSRKQLFDCIKLLFCPLLKKQKIEDKNTPKNIITFSSY